MSFNSGLSQKSSYSFMPDFPGLSSTFEHESIWLPRIRPLAWQPISLLARGLFLVDESTKADSPQPVRRAADTTPTSIQHMRIDHCRRHVLMSKQFLDCPNIVPVLKKVGCEGMAKRMATGWFGNMSFAAGLFHREGAPEIRTVC